MFGIDDALIIGAGASILGGILGNAASSSDREMALAQNKKAIQQWLDLRIPDPEQQKIFLKQYVQTGKLSPEFENAIQQDASEFKKIQVDPRFKEAQLQALGKLGQIGDQGGLTLSDEANLQKGMSDIASQDRGRREAILNQYGARGLGGSGLELQAQMMGNQQALNQSSQNQLSALGSARDRALQAIMQGGSLGGQMQNQAYGEQKDIAAAQDAINRFNTQNLQNIQRRNVGSRNDAQKYNLELQQGLANKNVDLANAQEKYNKELSQQNYQSQLQRTQGLAGQYNNMANVYGNEAQRKSDMWSGIGSGIGKIGASVAASNYGQPTTQIPQDNSYLEDKDKLDNWKWG